MSACAQMYKGLIRNSRLEKPGMASKNSDGCLGRLSRSDVIMIITTPIIYIPQYTRVMSNI